MINQDNLLRKNDIWGLFMNVNQLSLENLFVNIFLNGLNIKVIQLVKVQPDSSWTVPEHSHNDYEFHIIPYGKGYIGIQDHDLAVNGGEFYITGPHIRHKQLSDRENPMTEYCLECEINITDNLSEAFVSSYEEDRLLKDVLSGPYPIIFKDSNGISSLFEEIFSEIEKKDAGYYLKIQTLVIDILINLFRTVTSYENIKYAYAVPQKSIDDLRINRLVMFVETNYKRDISLADASKILFLSPRQINRLMQKKFKMTFHDYLLNHRLSIAKQLLEENMLSIESVAYESGFSSHFYMYQVFKRSGLRPPAKLRPGKP